MDRSFGTALGEAIWTIAPWKSDQLEKEFILQPCDPQNLQFQKEPEAGDKMSTGGESGGVLLSYAVWSS